MKVNSLLGFLLLFLAATPVSYSDSFSDVRSDPPETLLVTLKKFATARNHQSHPKEKEEAREFIKKSFQEAGLHVWSEEVVLNGTLRGENIVGMNRGSGTGNAADKIVIVGAHYDTVANTTGVDDNGSGVTALLEAAKQIGKARCKLKNTIMFVAFDFEEWTPECNEAWPITCGSREFVKNLTNYFKKTGGTVNGALILETIINFNSSSGAQNFPRELSQIIPKAYKEIEDDSFRGNFLAVIGRQPGDKKLYSLIQKNYEKGSGYRAQLITFPLTKRASNVTQYEAFYRSDHYRFWDHDAPYSALFLTDTADFRGYMQRCYHHVCDNLRLVENEDLEFLRRTINSVMKTTLELSEAEDCNPKTNIAPKSVAIGVVLLLVAILASHIVTE